MEEYKDLRNGKLKNTGRYPKRETGSFEQFWVDLDSTVLNQVGNEEIEKEIDESSKLKAAIQKRTVNIDLTNTANSSRDEELESFASKQKFVKKNQIEVDKKN